MEKFNINYKHACVRNQSPQLKTSMQTWEFHNRIIFWKPQEHRETSNIALSSFSLKGHRGRAETAASKTLTKFIDFFTFGLQIIYEVLQPTLLGQPLAIIDIFNVDIKTTCQEEMQSALLIHTTYVEKQQNWGLKTWWHRNLVIRHTASLLGIQVQLSPRN